MKIGYIMLVAALAGTPVLGSVTLNLTGGDLRDAIGTEIGVGNGLVLLIASTSDSDFGAPSPSSFLTQADDIIIYKGNVNGAGSSDPGAFSYPIAYDYGAPFPSSFNSGDPLMLYWYPSLSETDIEPGLGTSYGFFRNSTKLDIDDIAWFAPADGGTYALSFLTTSSGGEYDNLLGYVSETVVPEPGEYMALIGLASMGFVGLRRYFSRKG